MKAKIKELDPSNLRQVIIESPYQLTKGWELAGEIRVSGNFNRLVISGMGGSALPGELLGMFLEQKKEVLLEIIINRNYSLPKKPLEKSLHFFASYSGKTEETLSSLKEALEKKQPVVIFTTGGDLEKIAREKKLPWVLLPSGIEPRCAIGYFFSAMLKVLVNSGLIKEGIEDFSQVTEKIQSQMELLEKEGKEIAKKLKGQVPVIYASEFFRPLALIWKIALNENAKTPAFYNIYPELNHNEMVGFTLLQNKFHILCLPHPEDHPQILKRMKITAELLKEKGIETTFWEMPTGNLLETIFETVFLGEWISYYLALEYNQDPAPVALVEKLKILLK